MNARKWFQRVAPFNLLAKCFQRLTLPLLQNRKRLDDPIAQRVEKIRQALLHELENIPRELPVVRPLLDNDEIIHLAEALPDFGELRGHQLPEERPHAHVREIVSFAAYRAAARRVVTVLGMIEGLLHEPSERLRAVYADGFTDRFNERRVQLENFERATINVQRSTSNIELALPI